MGRPSRLKALFSGVVFSTTMLSGSAFASSASDLEGCWTVTWPNDSRNTVKLTDRDGRLSGTYVNDAGARCPVAVKFTPDTGGFGLHVTCPTWEIEMKGVTSSKGGVSGSYVHGETAGKFAMTRCRTTFVSPLSTPSKVVKGLTASLAEARDSFKHQVTATACLNAGISFSFANLSGAAKDEAVAFQHSCGIKEYKGYSRATKGMAKESDEAIVDLDARLQQSADYEVAPTLEYSLDSMDFPLQLLNIKRYDHKRDRMKLCYAAGALQTEVGFYRPMFEELNEVNTTSLEAHVSRLRDACRKNTMTEVDEFLVTKSTIVIYDVMNAFSDALGD